MGTQHAGSDRYETQSQKENVHALDEPEGSVRVARGSLMEPCVKEQWLCETLKAISTMMRFCRRFVRQKVTQNCSTCCLQERLKPSQRLVAGERPPMI